MAKMYKRNATLAINRTFAQGDTVALLVATSNGLLATGIREN